MGSAEDAWRPGGTRRIAVLVVAILVVAALARLVLAVILVPAWESRSGIGSSPDLYPTLAASLVDRHTLGYAPVGAGTTTGRGPGFPAWLALPMLAGLRGDRPIAFWATLPGLAGAAIAAFAWFRFRGPSAGAAVAAGIAALHPLPAFVSARTMSDEFCGVLGFVGLLAWACAESGFRRRWLWVALSGLALAGAILTRSSAILFLVAVVAVAVAMGSPSRRLLAVVVLALVPPIAWSARSSLLEGRTVFVHSLTAYNFWLGEAQDRYGFAANFGASRRRAHELLVTEGGLSRDVAERMWHAALSPEQTAAIESTLGRSAMARIARHPAGFVRRALRGVVWFWIRAETRARTLQFALAALPLVLFGAVGAIAGLRRSWDPWTLVLTLAVIFHVAAYAPICPMARYSVQVYPCLAFLAAAGVERIARRGRGIGVPSA